MRFLRALVGALAIVPALCSCAFAPDPVRVTVEVADDVFTYDGHIHMSSGIVGAEDDGSVVLTGSDGNQYTVVGLSVTNRARTPSDSSDNVRPTGDARVLDADGRDVTGDVILDFDEGSLTIEPRDLWLESGDVKRSFDGQVAGGGSLAREEGFVSGDGASYEFVGGQVTPGESENDFEVVWDQGTDPSCYEVHKSSGTIEVTGRDKGSRLKLVVPGRFETVDFDGKAHAIQSVESNSVACEVDGVAYEVVDVKYDGIKGTAIGTYEGRPKAGPDFGVYLASDVAREHDLSDQFDVSFEECKLVIEPGDLYVATFFGSEDDWTDSLFVSQDCSTFQRIGKVPLELRDPSIIWHDGLFWVVCSTNERDGCIHLRVCASDDLVNWTAVGTSGPIPVDVMPDAGSPEFDVVAPEWYLDEDGTLTIICSCGYWGGNHGEPTNDHMQSYMIDVIGLGVFDGQVGFTCAPARKMSVNADGADRIDGTIDRYDGAYWLTVKRNGLTMELWRNDRLSADGWKLVSDRCLYGFEAPCVVDVGDRVSLFADGVPDVAPYGVRRWVADSISGTWKSASLRFLDEGGAEIDHVRHGTVLCVDKHDMRDGWEVVASRIQSLGSSRGRDL